MAYYEIRDEITVHAKYPRQINRRGKLQRRRPYLPQVHTPCELVLDSSAGSRNSGQGYAMDGKRGSSDASVGMS